MAGNKKKSSPSDQGYWKRTDGPGRKTKRIIREAQRLDKLHPGKPNGVQYWVNKITANPKTPIKRTKPVRVASAANSALVPNLKPDLFPIHMITSNGVTLETSRKLSDIEDVKRSLHPKLQFTHFVIQPGGWRYNVEQRQVS